MDKESLEKIRSRAQLDQMISAIRHDWNMLSTQKKRQILELAAKGDISQASQEDREIVCVMAGMGIIYLDASMSEFVDLGT